MEYRPLAGIKELIDSGAQKNLMYPEAKQGNYIAI